MNEVKAMAAFRNTSENTAVSAFLAKRLFLNVQEIADTFKESLNYQVGQAQSQGKLTITDDNNPRGSIRTTFDYQVPAANIASKEWYESDGETAAGDPVNDIRDFIRELRLKVNGYQNVAVKMNIKTLYKLLKHDAVLKAIGYQLTGIGLRYSKSTDDNAMAVAKGASFEAQKNAFASLIECDELIVDKTLCGTEKLNTTSKKYERTTTAAFAEDVILIRPTGTIGVIKNVVPLRPDGSHIYTGIFGGRGLIDYIYTPDTYTQRWQGELTSLAVLNRPKDMYYMKVAKKPAQG